MILDIYFNDANTTVDFTGTNLKGHAGVDWTVAQFDSMRIKYKTGKWYCITEDAS